MVLTFQAEALPEGDYPCPSNDAVPYTVELRQPVGSRVLMDGFRTLLGSSCLAPGARCDPEQRWPVPG